jgi:hypothetical protein
VGFEQAAISIEKEREYAQLKDAVTRILAVDQVEQFLRRMQKKGVRIRDFDLILASGLLEDLDEPLAKSGKPARQWYQELAVSDQAQLREFYLSRIEQVEPGLRTRFHKLYRYY